jgi:Ca2+:H+ antiporter
MNAPANGSLGERETLLGSTLTHRDDESRWKTMPKHVARVTYATLASNYVNALLVFVPVGIVAGALHINPTAVFILNFIAIIPLASLLSFATEELSAKLGQTLGGLCNATFGNAVELIVSARDAGHCAPDSDSHRSPLSPSRWARSASCRPVCLVASSPTSSS